MTVISNCCDTISIPSDTFTVMIELPCALSIGLSASVYVPSDTDISSFNKFEIKAVLLDNTSTVKSSSSASVGIIWIVILSPSSSTTLGSSIDDNTGVSLIFCTVNVNWTLSESNSPSFTIISIFTLPK